MQEAIEAKEGLPVRPARRLLATVTMREYLRRYDRLAGMTGTAVSDAPVYRDLYGIEVIAIPTNVPTIRIDHPDVVYPAADAKLAALAAEVARRQVSGQPVLIGAMNTGDAAAVSALLAEIGASHEVLSVGNHERRPRSSPAQAGLARSRSW
jgi:preprotein translocase subunit SecA